jgi:hypothetical protein
MTPWSVFKNRSLYDNKANRSLAKIEIQPDCGNAPRKAFLKDLHTAIANGDLGYLASIIPEGITREIVGQQRINGKEDYLSEVASHELWKAKELIIDTMITHGPDACVSGHITTADNR